MRGAPEGGPEGVVEADWEPCEVWLDTDDEKLVDMAMWEKCGEVIKVGALSRERLEALRYSSF